MLCDSDWVLIKGANHESVYQLCKFRGQMERDKWHVCTSHVAAYWDHQARMIKTEAALKGMRLPRSPYDSRTD